MSDRFNSLKSSNKKDKFGRKSNRFHNPNNPNNPKNPNDPKNPNNPKNMFRKESKEKKKPNDNINLGVEVFPELNTKNKINTLKVNTDLSYLEKINQKKQELQQTKELIPKGWIFLNKFPSKENTKKAVQINNKYYNPALSKKIIENRIKYREEINEMLGDISPYWDVDIYGTTLMDEDENNDSDDDDYETDEEYNNDIIMI